MSGSMAPSFGILGLFGMLVELKHGIPEIYAPFAHCAGLADFGLAIMHMEDIVFVGILAWVAMLVLSIISIHAAFQCILEKQWVLGRRALPVKRRRDK
jgi:hypothetical protein